MRKEVVEEQQQPDDLRSLRLQLAQAEEAEAAHEELARRNLHKIASLREKIQIREFQEDPEKRSALEDLMHELNQMVVFGGEHSSLYGDLIRARDRVQELLDAPIHSYQKNKQKA